MAGAEIKPIIDALTRGDRQTFEAEAVTFVKQRSADELWTALGAAHGTSLDLFAQLSDWPDSSVRVAVKRLMPAVARVPAVTLGDAVALLRFAARLPVSFSYAATEQLRPHIVDKPELGVQLGEVLLHGEVTGEGALRVWAAAFATGTPKAAAAYTVALLDQVGIYAREQLQTLPQYLDTSQVDTVALLEPVEERLTAALIQATRESSRPDEAGVALTSIAAFSVSAMAALHDGIQAGEAWALVATSQWLQVRPSTTVGLNEVPVEDLVRLMLRHAAENEDARSAVDSTMGSLVYHDVTRPLIVRCLEDLGSLDLDLAELFPQAIDALCEHQSDFAGLLTRWLLAKNATFSAIRSLLLCCARGVAPAELDAEMFAAASSEEKVAAARKLLGLTNNGPVLCQFISVLAESPVLQPDGLNIAAQMLDEAFIEYPNATVEFLAERTGPAERAMPFSHVYRGVYANALRWRRLLARLPRLNELRPADSQLHALRLQKLRMNREIFRVANERSIFATLGTKMHIAQGRRFVARTARGLTSVSEMQEASHSVELPSSELADPVGGLLRRAQRLGTSR